MATTIVKAHRATVVTVVDMEATAAMARAMAQDMAKTRPTLLRVPLQLQGHLELEVPLSKTIAHNGHSTFSKTLNTPPITTPSNNSRRLRPLQERLVTPLHRHRLVVLRVMDTTR